jgi:hypothetical protein
VEGDAPLIAYVDRDLGMSSYSKERNPSRDLNVYFDDLNLEAPEGAGRISEQPLIFFPQQAFDAAVDCGLLLNREMIDIFQRNLNASFSLLTRLAGARSFSEIVELQAAHLSNHVAALIGQTEELATLSIKTTMDLFRLKSRAS